MLKCLAGSWQESPSTWEGDAFLHIEIENLKVHTKGLNISTSVLILSKIGNKKLLLTFPGPCLAEELSMCLVCLSEMLKYKPTWTPDTGSSLLNGFVKTSGIPQIVFFSPLLFPKSAWGWEKQESLCYLTMPTSPQPPPCVPCKWRFVVFWLSVVSQGSGYAVRRC